MFDICLHCDVINSYLPHVLWILIDFEEDDDEKK